MAFAWIVSTLLCTLSAPWYSNYPIFILSDGPIPSLAWTALCLFTPAGSLPQISLDCLNWVLTEPQCPEHLEVIHDTGLADWMAKLVALCSHKAAVSSCYIWWHCTEFTQSGYCCWVCLVHVLCTAHTLKLHRVSWSQHFLHSITPLSYCWIFISKNVWAKSLLCWISCLKRMESTFWNCGRFRISVGLHETLLEDIEMQLIMASCCQLLASVFDLLNILEIECRKFTIGGNGDRWTVRHSKLFICLMRTHTLTHTHADTDTFASKKSKTFTVWQNI